MSVLGTGLSGLLAFQRALATTSHNIANSSTEGYSRQRVDLTARNPVRLGPGYLGQGIAISGIRRLQDDFVTAQLRSSLMSSANGETRAVFAERADRLLADETTGVAPILESFFSAAQEVADDPTALPGRTVFLSEAETLAERFSLVNGQLDEQRGMVNGQLATAVDDINQYAQALANLNRQIVSRSTAGSPPNDLLDHRDTLLNRLSAKIDLNLATQDDGSVNVFIGNGQPLVMSGGASELVLENLSGDPHNLDIGLKTSASATPLNVTRFMGGSEVGALLETRSGILDTAQNQLGLIALNLTTRFNEQNRLGLDLDGELGGDIFKLPEVKVYARIANAATDAPGVTIADVGQLTASDYRLHYDGANYQLTRVPANTSVTLVPDVSDPNLLIGDGLAIDTASIAGAAAGDSWLIQPTREAANELSVVLTDPARLAAASGALADSANTGDARPTGLRLTAAPPPPDAYLPAAAAFDAATGTFSLVSPQYGADSGDATIESFRVLDPQALATLDPSTAITFDATTNQFDVGGERFALDPSGTTTIAVNGWELKVQGTPATGTAFTVGMTSTPLATPQPAVTTLAGNGWELDLRGTPDANDLFTVDLSKNRAGDNRNMLALAELQSARVVEGRTTFQGGYTNLLADVGTQTRQAQIVRDSSATLLESAQAEREAISGVNLDEEAADLIRFQQAYQAAAQVITTANAMFDTLLNAVGR